MLSDGLKAKAREKERAQKARETELSAAEPGLEPKGCAGCPPKKRRPRKPRKKKEQ